MKIKDVEAPEVLSLYSSSVVAETAESPPLAAVWSTVSFTESTFTVAVVVTFAQVAVCWTAKC